MYAVDKWFYGLCQHTSKPSQLTANCYTPPIDLYHHVHLVSLRWNYGITEAGQWMDKGVQRVSIAWLPHDNMNLYRSWPLYKNACNVYKGIWRNQRNSETINRPSILKLIPHSIQSNWQGKVSWTHQHQQQAWTKCRSRKHCSWSWEMTRKIEEIMTSV